MWLCIDQGGRSTRAAVVDESGKIVAEDRAGLETTRRDPHYVEHEPAQLLESVSTCLRSVARQLGGDCARVRAAGLATQRSTLVCAAKHDGTALSPLISWQDRRGQEDLRRFAPQAERIKALTGLRLSPHYGVAKLRWCLQHLELVSQRLAEHDLVGAPLVSFVLRHIAADDAWRVDPVNASRTLLMDMRSARWSDELLALFSVPAETLPDIQPCRSTFGVVDLGGHRVPLTVATGDQAAAVYCTGAPAPGTAFVNVGTGAFIQTITGQRPALDDRLLSSIVWQDTQTTTYVLEGTVNGAAGAVDKISADIGRHFDPADAELIGALERICDAPLFLNGISGLGSPDWVADFPSGFTAPGAAPERIAAVYESIVFLIVRNLLHMRRSVALDAITITGGVSRLDWLAQRLADVSGLPVHRPHEAEATVLGLAYLVSEGQCRVSGAGASFEPVPNAVAEQRFADWTAAMEAAIARNAGAMPT